MLIKSSRRPILAASVALGLALVSRVDAAGPSQASGWNSAAAARYLDTRLAWWRAWPKSERDHGTRCISCHTALPIALAKPTLRKSLGERGPSATEQAMYADITKRVMMWRDVEPFYLDQKSGLPKSSESRAVEAVLNSLFLVTRDNENGGHLSDDTKQAFANLWPLQMQATPLKGGFAWLTFKLEPWESETATYWGASLAAIAVGRAPDGYAASPTIAPNVEALRAYLRTGTDEKSSLFTRMLVLWADANLHGILEPAKRQAITDELLAAQGADGGWSLTKLSSWQRRDESKLDDTSDGFATALITLALGESGQPAKAKPMQAARAWLTSHQDQKTGSLPAVSINKKRETSHDAYLFMTDAATGYATLALAQAKEPKPKGVASR
jgi:hypothetical protein